MRNKAICQFFSFETDCLPEFLTAMRAMLPILVSAGQNPKVEYHNLSYSTDTSDYWTMESDSKNRILCFSLKKTYGEEREGRDLIKMKPIEVPNPNLIKDNNPDLKWSDKSYDTLLELIKRSVYIDSDKLRMEFAKRNMRTSSGMTYKAVLRPSATNELYISMGFTYYGK